MRNEQYPGHVDVFQRFAMDALVATRPDAPLVSAIGDDGEDEFAVVIPDSDSDEDIKFGGRLMARAPASCCRLPACSRAAAHLGDAAGVPASLRPGRRPPRPSLILPPPPLASFPLNRRNEHAGDADH
jgi:hypothetical protein